MLTAPRAELAGRCLSRPSCYDSDGAKADTKYLVMVSQVAASDVVVLGYARTISSTNAETDLTGGIYNFNATGGSIVSTRAGTGQYTVTFAGADFSTSHPQVSGLFATRHCGVAQQVVAESRPVDCEWVIPPPPEGETFDPNKVNVSYTTGSGELVALFNVPGADGWDPSALHPPGRRHAG